MVNTVMGLLFMVLFGVQHSTQIIANWYFFDNGTGTEPTSKHQSLSTKYFSWVDGQYNVRSNCVER
jgi:hypothetical protein